MALMCGLAAGTACGAQDNTVPAKDADPAPIVMDGRATLSVGTLSLREGTDFKLLVSPGSWVTGPLQRPGDKTSGFMTSEGGVRLLGRNAPGRSSMQAVQAASHGKAGLLIVVEDDSTREFAAQASTNKPGGPAIIAVRPAMMDQLMAIRDGESAVLAVHPRQQTTPREKE